MVSTTSATLNKLKEREKTLAMADVRPITEEERKVIINNAMNDEKIGDKALEVLKYIEYLSRIYISLHCCSCCYRICCTQFCVS